MLIRLDKLFQLSIDFENIYIIDEKIKNLGKKVLINTSTKVFNNQKYENLYIIEPRASYLIPLTDNHSNNETYIVENLIGETGIILQLLQKYILLYNTNENFIYLNKNIPICNIKEEVR